MQGERAFTYIKNVGTVLHRAHSCKQWIENKKIDKRMPIFWKDASKAEKLLVAFDCLWLGWFLEVIDLFVTHTLAEERNVRE